MITGDFLLVILEPSDHYTKQPLSQLPPGPKLHFVFQIFIWPKPVCFIHLVQFSCFYARLLFRQPTSHKFFPICIFNCYNNDAQNLMLFSYGKLVTYMNDGTSLEKCQTNQTNGIPRVYCIIKISLRKKSPITGPKLKYVWSSKKKFISPLFSHTFFCHSPENCLELVLFFHFFNCIWMYS